MPVMMTGLQEKVFIYLKEHKTPVLAKTLAKRFIVSDSAVSSALKYLHEKQLADLIKVGNQKFYKLKD
jgi:Mn-dependent DtxR family transcriptional regulator